MELPGRGACVVAGNCGCAGGKPKAAMIAAADSGTASVAQLEIRGLAAGAMAAAAMMVGTTSAARCSAGAAPIAAHAMAGARDARWGRGRAPMAAETTRGTT